MYGALFAVGAWAGLVSSAFPQLDDLEARAEVRQVPGAIYARDGKTVLRRLRAPESRTYIEESDLPDVLVDAAVAAEDRRFFEHNGVDVRGIARAALVDVRAGAAKQGGSTITQQLVKNAYVGPDRSIGRKTREAVLAVALETRWSKRRILAAYLNTAYYGSGLYGIADAARGYFDVPIAKLSPAQAAMLTGLLTAPERNNPVTNPAGARAERDRVLGSMRETGALDAARFARAEASAITLRKSPARKGRGEIAPQFADAVASILIERYGVRRALGSGLKVTTTLDATLQAEANRALVPVRALGLDAALVAIDPTTGEVRAMANGGGARTTAFNVALDGRRQPGSAFKPFMLAAAYDNGLTPKSPVLSAPFDKAYDGGRFRVNNGGGYAGKTTLERATWQSDNTVYARLQDRFGIQSAIDIARAAGIRSDIDAVPAAVLGALPEGTTPTELAHAYATFAAHGKRTSLVQGGGPRMVGRVVEGADAGEHTWRPTSVRRETIPRGEADLVTATLRGVIRTGTGQGASIGRPAAGKTGTTEDYRDAWFVGYTPNLAVAVWVGHAEGGVPMRTENGGGPVTGGSIPASIWRSFMTEMVEGTPVAQFNLETPKFVTARIDPDSGLLAGVWCEGAETATFIQGKEPTENATDCAATTRPAPDLVGLSLNEARGVLADGEFAPGGDVEERFVTQPLRIGTVLSQEPPAGTEIARADTIALVVGADPFGR